MNKKIEKFMKERKDGESEAFALVLNPFVDRLTVGEVVEHNEIKATLADARLYAGEEKIEKALHEIADKRDIFLVKERRFYALADDDDVKIYVSNEKHETRVAFGVFGLLLWGLFIIVLPWTTPDNTNILAGSLMIWLGIFIFTTFEAFRCKRVKFFGNKDSQGEKHT